MTVSLSDAIDDLLTRATQDPGRLNKLAEFCIEEFAKHGLGGVRGGQADEVGIRGFSTAPMSPRARNKSRIWPPSFIFAAPVPPPLSRAASFA
jgi:hypothetical protein